MEIQLEPIEKEKSRISDSSSLNDDDARSPDIQSVGNDREMSSGRVPNQKRGRHKAQKKRWAKKQKSAPIALNNEMKRTNDELSGNRIALKDALKELREIKEESQAQKQELENLTGIVENFTSVARESTLRKVNEFKVSWRDTRYDGLKFLPKWLIGIAAVQLALKKIGELFTVERLSEFDTTVSKVSKYLHTNLGVWGQKTAPRSVISLFEVFSGLLVTRDIFSPLIRYLKYWYVPITLAVVARILHAFRPTLTIRKVGELGEPFDDLRPDANALLDMKHENPLVSKCRLEDPTPLSGGSQELNVSFEIVAQLTTPTLMNPARDEEVARERIYFAASRMQTVNIDRYEALTGEHIYTDSATVAYAMFLANKQKYQKTLSFACPPEKSSGMPHESSPTGIDWVKLSLNQSPSLILPLGLGALLRATFGYLNR